MKIKNPTLLGEPDMSMRCFALSLILFTLGSPLAHSTEGIRLTIYDDGLSCPGNCDAHVVFQSSLNGTEFAHAIATPKPPYSACKVDADCQICFSAGGQQCINVMYRSAGPTAMTFDLTPAFYEEACPKAKPFPALQSKCDEIAKGAAGLADRTNCIQDAAKPGCKSVVDAARLHQDEDRLLYDECKAKGEAKFNATRTKDKRRSNNCAYEFAGTGGPNSKGTTWRRLMPGACRPGTFVGRDGLDCCNGRPISDGPLGIECRGFYLKP